MDSPTPSALTRPSGETFIQTLFTTRNNGSQEAWSRTEKLAITHASLDVISQIAFLVIILLTLLTSNANVNLHLLSERKALFACAFALSMRLMLPIANTIVTISSSGRVSDAKAKTILAALGLSIVSVSLLTATASLLLDKFSSHAASSLFLLLFMGTSVCISSFVSLRVAYIRRRARLRHAVRENSMMRGSRLPKEPLKEAVDLPSTMSSAGTKASSVNPYDAALRRSMLVQSKLEEVVEQLASPVEKDFIPMTSMSVDQHASLSSSIQYSNSRDGSNLWLEQAHEDERDEIVGEHYEASYLAPPSEDDDQRRNGTGTRLRIHPSARDLMASLSSSESLGTYASAIQLPPIWFALGSIWLISLLSSPLLIISTTTISSGTLSLVVSACFCVAMAISGPLLLLQTCLTIPSQRRQPLSTSRPESRPDQREFLPRPSFATSYLSGRSSKASGGSFMKDGVPVAGNAFEPVNGYDNPILFRKDDASRDHRTKSIIYDPQHWAAGKIKGDVVMSSQGLLGRAANIMSPRPKLQVMSPQRQSSMPGHLRTYSDEIFDDEEGYEKSIGCNVELLDISQTSVVIPGALPYSPAAIDIGETSLQDQRRIHTIYEVDTSQASSHQSSLRQRRASVIGLNESASIYSEPGLSRRDDAITSGHDMNWHRGSLSLSMIHQRKSDWSNTSSRLDCIADVSIHDIDFGDLSNASFVSAEDSDGTARGEEYIALDRNTVEVSKKEEDIECSRNWTTIDDSTVPESSSLYEADISAASSRSLHVGLDILDAEVDQPKAMAVVQSTPPLSIKRQGKLCAVQDSNMKRKSLGSDMGLDRNTTIEDSPCRTSSDLSSLCQKRATIDSITDSLISSGCDGHMTLSPDGTIERVTRVQENIEREIIVIEMDESISENRELVDEGSIIPSSVVDDMEEAGAIYGEVCTYTTQRYYQHHEQGNWLDPVEEVTEEPTISMSADESSPRWTPKSNSTVNSTKLYRLSHRRTMTPQSAAWAKLNGLATPSSVASSPLSQSRYGWAEVIESGHIATRTSLIKGRRRLSLNSISSSNSTPHNRVEVNLSPHARAYLASRCATPSRIIGLQSKFWSASPPKLALDALALQQQSQSQKRRSGGLMKSMSPLPSSRISCEEASWVDGAIEEEDEENARKQMEIVEKRWKRQSRRMQGTDMTPKPPQGVYSGLKKRSSANMQGIIDAALRRGSGAFKKHSKRDSIKSSSRSSMASQLIMTPTIKVTDEDDEGNDSEVTVTGGDIPSTPSTPRRVSTALSEYSQISSTRPPTKREGSVRSVQSQEMLESPSSGKGSFTNKRKSMVMDKRCSPLRKVEYRVHQRKESRVRETVKLLENAVKRAAMMQEAGEIASSDLACPVSPRKKAHSRVVVRGSPGKFRLEEAAADAPELPIAVNEEAVLKDQEIGVQRQFSLRRSASNRVNRFTRRRNYPQIFVRPPSGSSTHTQQLLQ